MFICCMIICQHIMYFLTLFCVILLQYAFIKNVCNNFKFTKLHGLLIENIHTQFVKYVVSC